MTNVQSLVGTQEKAFVFLGKKMNYAELAAAVGVEGQDASIQVIVIEKLVKKGSVRVITNATPAEKALMAVQQELATETAIESLSVIEMQEAKFARDRKTETKLKHEEVEIDVPTQRQAEILIEYIGNTLNLDAQAELDPETGIYTIVVRDLTESELGAIKRKKKSMETGRQIIASTDKAATAAIKSIAFATDNIIAPATKGLIKTVIATAKSATKATTQIGASTVTNTADSGRQLVKELSTDRQVLQAKQDLVNAKDIIMGMFRKGGTGKGSDIRIK